MIKTYTTEERSRLSLEDQLESNIKYRYIKDSIDFIRYKSEYSAAHYSFYSIHNFIREFNTICVGGTRQSGKSIAIKRVFRPEHDIYIGFSKAALSSFIDDTILIDTGDVLHTWTDNDNFEKIKERDALLSMRSHNIFERIVNALTDQSVVFIDVESVCIQSHQAFVNDVIAAIDIHMAETNNIDAAVNTIVVYS